MPANRGRSPGSVGGAPGSAQGGPGSNGDGTSGGSQGNSPSTAPVSEIEIAPLENLAPPPEKPLGYEHIDEVQPTFQHFFDKPETIDDQGNVVDPGFIGKSFNTPVFNGIPDVPDTMDNPGIDPDNLGIFNGWEVPIVLDLDGDGIELTGIEASAAFYDFNGDGYRELTGWVSGDDGLLAIDLASIDVINTILDETASVTGDDAPVADAVSDAEDVISDGNIDPNSDVDITPGRGDQPGPGDRLCRLD